MIRSILRQAKVIAISSIIFFIFLTSCNRHQLQTESSTIATRFIQIIDRDSVTHRLIIRNEDDQQADTFQVYPGQKIKWLLGNGQSVAHLTNIYKKPDSSSENIWNVIPHAIGGSLNWEGIIDRHAAGKTEEYNIDWIDRNGNPHTYDPLIQVRPRNH